MFVIAVLHLKSLYTYFLTSLYDQIIVMWLGTAFTALNCWLHSDNNIQKPLRTNIQDLIGYYAY